MAFAPHTNTDVRHALHCGKTPPLLLGMFNNHEHGKLFEYAVRPDEGIDFAPDCPHIVYVTNPITGIDSGFRYAKVLKTVAWVVVDEDANGQPVYEKWKLRGHSQYPTEWVFKD